MILLDTNVLSELMRSQPDAGVLAWIDDQSSDDLMITSITVAEILHGIARLPDGRRKAALREAAIAMFAEEFAGRILAFDEQAAQSYADLVSARERHGRPISMADAQIAAILKSQHIPILATRNSKDFVGLDIELVDPWQAA